MNKKIFAVMGITIVVLLGAVVYLATQQSPTGFTTQQFKRGGTPASAVKVPTEYFGSYADSGVVTCQILNDRFGTKMYVCDR